MVMRGGPECGRKAFSREAVALRALCKSGCSKRKSSRTYTAAWTGAPFSVEDGRRVSFRGSYFLGRLKAKMLSFVKPRLSNADKEAKIRSIGLTSGAFLPSTRLLNG